MRLILLALMALSAPAAALQSAAPAIATQPSGLELAQTISSVERQLRQVDVLLDGTYNAIMASDANIKAMQAQYPDMKSVWIKAMQPIMIEEMKKQTPGYHSELAMLYDANFSKSELQQLIRFWKSSTGQNLLDRVQANVNFKNVATEMAADLEAETDVSKDAITRDKNAAVIKTMGSLPKAELDAITRFGMSPAGKKFTTIRPKKDAIDAKWFNIEPSKESLARIDKEVPAAMDAYMAEVDAAAALEKANKPIAHRP